MVDTNSDGPPPKLKCHSNDIRICQNQYSNGRKRDSNTFEFAKSDIRITENEIQMHLNSPKPIFEYWFSDIRILVFGYSNIVLAIFGFSFGIFSLVMTYKLYVRRPPCGISVHPRLDFGWSDVASGCVKQQYGWIGLLPRLHVT